MNSFGDVSLFYVALCLAGWLAWMWAGTRSILAVLLPFIVISDGFATQWHSLSRLTANAMQEPMFWVNFALLSAGWPLAWYQARRRKPSTPRPPSSS